MELADTIPQDVSEATARRVEEHRAWMGIATLASGGFLLVQLLLAARTLGPAGLGMVAVAIAAVTALRSVLTLRTRPVVLRYLHDALTDRDFAYAGATLKFAALLETLMTGAALAVVLALAPDLGRLFIKDPAGANLITIYAMLVIPCGLVTQTSLAVLQYFGRFDIEVLVRLAHRGAALAATLGAIFVGGTMEAFILAAAIGQAIGLLLLAGLAVIEARRRMGDGWLRAKLAAMRGRVAGFVRASLRTTFGATLSTVTREGDALWIGWFGAPIAAGYYAVAQTLAGLATVPPAPFAQRAFPHVVRLASKERWQDAYAIRSRAVMLVGVGVALALIVFGVSGRELVRELMGRAFEPAADPLIILLGATGIAAAAMWSRPILVASNRPPSTPLTALLAAGTKIGLALLLVPRHGATGAAWAMGAATLVASGLTALRAHAAAQSRPAPRV
jgi:O-antigen/teichoic acid export membrane protein